MRQFICLSTILILAINGIACACPSDLTIEDHSSHQMHSDASAEEQSECCDNCDEITAAKMHGDLTLFGQEKSKHHDFESPNRFEFEIYWDEDPVAQRSFAKRDKPTPLPTPVMFFDRMLD